MSNYVIERNYSLWAVLAGVIVAGLSPFLEIITGHPLGYMLPLTAGAGLIWGLARLSRAEMGLRGGRPGDHLLALLYPVLAIGFIVAIARLTGNVAPEPGGSEYLKQLGLMFVSTWIGVLLTEEILYRGALWGLSVRAGWRPLSILLWTSLAFAAWHIAVPIIEKDFLLPSHQLPIYYANVLLLGLCWGLFRMVSGSVLVACTAHASWNALVYVLFGYGLRGGWLGITRLTVFGPERGVLGILVNGVVVALLVIWSLRRGIPITGARPGASV